MDEQTKKFAENISPSENTQTTLPTSLHRKAPLFVWFIFLFLIIFVCGFFFLNKNSLTLQKHQLSTVLPSPTQVPQFIGNYSVDVKVNKTSPCNTDTYLDHCTSDIYLKDNSSGKEVFFMTTNDVLWRNDVRTPVYKNGYIFLIKRTGNTTYPSNDWTDELWLYTNPNQGKLLYSAKGFYFDVNNNASLVLIPSPTNQTVEVINLPQAKEVNTYTIDQARCMPDQKVRVSWNGTPSTVKWDKDNTTYWGDYEGEYAFVGCFWKLNTLTRDVTYYPVPKPEFFFDLNLDKLVALYTDKPPFVAEGQQEAWQATTPTYSLYLYNLLSQQSSVIATFSSHYDYSAITTNWISPSQLQYTAPGGIKIYTLNE